MINVERLTLIFGTDHRYQHGSNELSEKQHRAFRLKLSSISASCGVRAIAEENSLQAVHEQDRDRSVVAEVAEMLHLSHRYCDPEHKKRAELGISQKCAIRASAARGSWPENRVREEIKLSHNRREAHWVEQLRELDQWPVLFICGADHSQTFCSVLHEHGINADIVEYQWSAE